MPRNVPKKNDRARADRNVRKVLRSVNCRSGSILELNDGQEKSLPVQTFWDAARVLQLRKMMEVEGKTTTQAAAHFDKSQSTTAHAMKRYGIKSQVRGTASTQSYKDALQRSAQRSVSSRERFDRLWKGCEVAIRRTIRKNHRINEDLAEEVISLILRSAWLAFDRFEDRGEGSFNAWISSLISNAKQNAKAFGMGTHQIDSLILEKAEDFSIITPDSIEVTLLNWASELASDCHMCSGERERLSMLLGGSFEKRFQDRWFESMKQKLLIFGTNTKSYAIREVYRDEVSRHRKLLHNSNNAKIVCI